MIDSGRGNTRPRLIGITFNPANAAYVAAAEALAADLARRGIDSWRSSTHDPGEEALRIGESDLVICLGGDGTVLRCVRLGIEASPLILGVNMGRLGFLTEIEGGEVLTRLDEILSGAGRIETRSMIEASVSGKPGRFHGLNEVAVGRATISRAIQLAVDIDGVRVADYRCDGVIIATATGSTAYALSVGGPIMPPESSEMVVVPVAPHLAAQHAVVLPGSEIVKITLEPRQEAVLSVDGEPDQALHEGDSVIVRASPHKARFLRLNPPTDFYLRMAARLGWARPGGSAEPLPQAGAEAARSLF